MRCALLLVVLLAGCGSDQAPPETGLSVARAVHTATRLGSQVLIAGGCVTDGCGTATDTTELYDARSGHFRSGPRLTGPRDGHTATPLDGHVLLAGGYAGEGQGALATAEICDATRCRSAGRLTRPRGGHAAASLPGGHVLVTGGIDATTDIYDGDGFRAGPRMRHARAGHTATTLPDGRVLVAGGYGRDGRAIAEAELFDGRRFVPAASPPAHG
jgi:hypothetical protein